MIAVGAVGEALEGSGKIVDLIFAQHAAVTVASFVLVRPTALSLLYKLDCACLVWVRLSFDEKIDHW